MDYQLLLSRVKSVGLTPELARRIISPFSSDAIHEAEKRALDLLGFPPHESPASLLDWLESGHINAQMARGMYATFDNEPDRDIYLTPSVIIGIAVAAQVYIYAHPSSRIIVADNRVAELRHVVRDPAVVYSIDPYSFEELVAFIYELMGLQVELTRKSRDGGADVLVWHPSGIPDTIFRAIQVKRYSPTHKVGLAEVQRMKGVLLDFRAQSGEIVTTSWFTMPAKHSASRPPVTISLMDYDGLVNRIKQALSGEGSVLQQSQR